MLLLQEKINAYLRFVESGELYDEYPQAADREVVISVVGQYPLSKKALAFYETVSLVVQQVGFELRFELLAPKV